MPALIKLDIKPDQLVLDIASYIKSVQAKNGAIAWNPGGKLDPWDHSEAIMALSIANEHAAAKKAFEWLNTNQNNDGTWFTKYLGKAEDGDLDRFKIETNFVAYPATALWHAYLCSNDGYLVAQYFPMIELAIDYVCAEQSTEGEIQWAKSSKEDLAIDALVTASASILRSIECALYLADKMDKPKPLWLNAHRKLAEALKNKPWRFDRSWESKERYSMDWFYPILSGVYSKTEAKLRIQQGWQKFVVKPYGCRCVSDEPWVTVAESCELVMAMIASGMQAEASNLFCHLQRWRDHDGAYWTGYQYREQCIWPEEKTTWTAAAAALACDALYQLTPASNLFTTPSGLFFS